MTLHFYFARQFLKTVLSTILVFFVILFLLDMIEQIRKFGSTDASFGALLSLTALNVPDTLYRILPLIMILATVALFLRLARSSELVVTRASGRSALKSLVAPLIVTFVIGIVAVGVIEVLRVQIPEGDERQAQLLGHCSGIVLGIFTVEIALRIGAVGRKLGRYWSSRWNQFDVAIVAIR